MRCPTCGARNPDEFEFCWSCEFDFVPPGPAPAEPPGVFTMDMHTRQMDAVDAVIQRDHKALQAMHDYHLTTDSAARKDVPLATGLLDYFPDALAAVARLSKIGNDKHNPGQPLHWSRGKSDDHADCIMRHMVDRGTVDTDGELHDTKVAWRALAQLQLAIEKRRANTTVGG